MPFAEVTMYVAVCDGCGNEADYGDEYSGWSDKTGAIEMAHDWRQEDERLLCGDCRREPGGDLYEEWV